MRQFKAVLVGWAAFIVGTLCLLTVAHARADEPTPQPFDISSESLATALNDFAHQSHRELLFAPSIVGEKATGGVHGTMQPLAALRLLLKDTGLGFATTPSGAVLIGDPATLMPAAGAVMQSTPGDLAQPAASAREGLQLAQANQGVDASTPAVKNTSSSGSLATAPLTEIIVTAQKREERLQDVPLPVTAITADVLLESNQTRVQDFYTRVPGLTVSSDGYHSMSSLAIRGISPDGFGNPTVGITVDDVPLGAPTTFGYGQFSPDIDPNDLSSIEVLRGPQGTLYGANSLGGLLKYVTVDPSTDAWSGRFESGISSVHNGAQLGYEERASANVPINDTLAIRVSGFTRQTPGYIDDPALEEKGANWSDAYGGRLALLWQISPVVSLNLSALLQDSIQHGAPYVDVGAGLGDLQQDYVRGTGAFSQQIQLYTAKLTAKLADIDVKSVSGYSVNSFHDAIDDTPYFGTATLGGVGTETEKNRMFTQEIRLSSSIGQRIDWLVGGFYMNAKTPDAQTVANADPTTGAQVGSLLYFESDPATYTESAAFADLTFHFTEQFDIQIGGRGSWNKQSYQTTQGGPVCGCGAISVGAVEHSNDNAFTYLVTPQYKFSPDLMVYARLASGYRPGGPNTPLPGIPPDFKHDTTENYELGLKGSALDHLLTFDTSVYYIDWKNIEISLLAPSGFGYYTNGNTAKSEGVEFSAESRPFAGFTVSAWIAWNEAVLTAPFPVAGAGSAVGDTGDRLPNAARISGNVSVEQQFPLTREVTGFVGGSWSYVGNQEGVFTASPQRQEFAAYTKTDLRGGMKYDTWTFNLYANNVADKRAAISGGIGSGPFPDAFIYIQPLTVGASIAKKF